MTEPKMPLMPSPAEISHGPDKSTHEKPTTHIDTKNPEVISALASRINGALNKPSISDDLDETPESQKIHWQKRYDENLAAGKPTTLAEKMLAKINKALESSTEPISQEQKNPMSSPESSTRSFDETIGNIQAQIAEILGKPYSIFQGGYEIQAANDAVTADKNALLTAQRGENADATTPMIQTRLVESQKKYISLLEKMRDEKKQSQNKLNETTGFISDQKNLNSDHRAEISERPDNSDPRDALNVQIAYEDALKKLNGSLTPELITLKGSLDSLPRDAEESEKRTARLAFLKALETKKPSSSTTT